MKSPVIKSSVKKNTPIPHFELSRELFAALDFKEVMATIEALQECGRLRLPYPLQTVRFNMEDYAEAPGWGQDSRRNPDCWITFQVGDYMRWTPKITEVHLGTILYVEQVPDGEFIIDTENNLWEEGGKVWPISAHNQEVLKTWRQTSCYVARLLVAALATKNIVKHTAFNRRANRGIGNGQFRGCGGVVRASCTRLDVPHEYAASGRRVRFHMRRGHYHHFRTGKGRVGRVRKFIPPILVNKDLVVGGVPTPAYAVVP